MFGRLSLVFIFVTLFFGSFFALTVPTQALLEDDPCYNMTECTWRYEVDDNFGNDSIMIIGSIDGDFSNRDATLNLFSRCPTAAGYENFGGCGGGGRTLAVNPCNVGIGIIFNRGDGLSGSSVSIGNSGIADPNNPDHFTVSCDEGEEEGSGQIEVHVDITNLSAIGLDQQIGQFGIELYEGDSSGSPIDTGQTTSINTTANQGVETGRVTELFEGDGYGADGVTYTACSSELSEALGSQQCATGTGTGSGVLNIVITVDGAALVDSGRVGGNDGDGGDDNPDDGQLETPDPTCEGSIFIIGWIVCPVAEFLLDSLEAIIRDGVVRSILNFDALDGETSQEAALRSIWVGFRTIANVGFVIAFFIVIYSAATGGALSAYDLKKLAPKLVAGALLVQLSFFICVQLVRIFNALGESVVDLMLSPLGGEGGAGTGSLFNSDISFDILQNAIDGGTEIVSALILVMIIIATLFSIAGVMLMVVVFLLRNMALMVLTVISPLAFVAWILPNTENLFKKWWGFYIQLLALFPIAMAFLASGRLVSSIWAAGDGWANQWVGLIALFIPYIIAPKLFSLAGSAVGSIVRGVEGARDGVKQRGSRLRQSELGKRTEAGAKARGAAAINRRYGQGGTHAGNGGRFNKAATWAAQTGYAQRATARAQQAQRNIQNEDAGAAKANVDANRSEARRGYNGKTGDEAEVEYLSGLLAAESKATEAEKEAAVQALLNVHSTRGDAVASVSDFMKRLDQESKGGSHTDVHGNTADYAGSSSQDRASAGALRGRLIENNKGSLGAVPQLAKPNAASTIAGMDAREVHSLKGGSVEHFADDKDAARAIAERSVNAVRSGSTESQMVRDANVSKLYKKALENGDHETVQTLKVAFDFDDAGNVSARKPAVSNQQGGGNGGGNTGGGGAPVGGGGGGGDAPTIILPNPNDPNARVDSSDLPPGR